MRELALGLAAAVAVTSTVAPAASAQQLSPFVIWLISTLADSPELKEILELQNDPDVQELGGLHPKLQKELEGLGDQVVKQIKDRLETDNLPSLTLDTEALATELGLNKITSETFSKLLKDKLATEGLGEALENEFKINPDKILDNIGGNNLGDKIKDHLKDKFNPGELDNLKPDGEKIVDKIGGTNLGDKAGNQIKDKLGTDRLGEDIAKEFPFDVDKFKKQTGIEALEKMSSGGKTDDPDAAKRELITQVIIGVVGSIGVLALLAHIITITPQMVAIAQS